jgi:hypothetical protein
MRKRGYAGKDVNVRSNLSSLVQDGSLSRESHGVYAAPVKPEPVED